MNIYIYICFYIYTFYILFFFLIKLTRDLLCKNGQQQTQLPCYDQTITPSQSTTISNLTYFMPSPKTLIPTEFTNPKNARNITYPNQPKTISPSSTTLNQQVRFLNLHAELMAQHLLRRVSIPWLR